MIQIIIGCPCSGKNTHVRENAQRGDLIFDYDSIHSSLSGQSLYDHLPNIRPFVLAARNAIYDILEGDLSQSAWIITATNNMDRITDLRQRFDAKVVYLKVDRTEAHRRAEDGNRPLVWHGYIDNWFDNVDLEVFGKEVKL